MHAVSADLRVAFGHERAHGDIAPPLGVAELGEQRRRIEEAERFAGEIGVARAVDTTDNA